MSCSQTVPCDNPGRCAGCCGVQCPPEGLCKSITIKYECYGSDAPPCPCVSQYSKMYGFISKFIKSKTNKSTELIKYFPNTNEELGITGLPEPPNFNINQDYIKIKDSEFVFAQSCSIPCCTATLSGTSGSSCGMTESFEDYCDECCCPCNGKVKCSGGGCCGASVKNCTLVISNPCCSCCEVSRDCDTGGSLWNKKKLKNNKIKLSLNKQEFIKRINNMKKFRIARRRGKIR